VAQVHVARRGQGGLVAGRGAEGVDEGALERRAGGTEQGDDARRRAQGEAHRLVADVVAEPGVAGAHAQRLARHLEQLARPHRVARRRHDARGAVAGGVAAGGVALGGVAAVGVAAVGVARRPHVAAEQGGALALEARVAGGGQRVEGGAQRGAPALVGGGVLTAAAVGAPPLDAVRAAPARRADEHRLAQRRARRPRARARGGRASSPRSPRARRGAR
jgi:hypothetical protein